MNQIKSVLRELDSPQIIVNFQRLCGVNHVSELSQSKNTNENLALYKEKQQKPRLVDIVSNDEDRDFHQRHGSHVKPTPTADNSHLKSKADVSTHVQINNKLLHQLFCFGSALGNEIFYITFFPFFFWNVDSYIARRLCLTWCLVMYLGQVTKDIVKLPRPPSPPVVRLEKQYDLEYGMPSTHTMAGTVIPFCLLALSYQRYEFPFVLGLIPAVLWCLLVTSSRLYLGMHSVLDVLAGLLYVAIIIPPIFPYLDTIDEFTITNSFSPLVIISITFSVCLFYPTLEHWNSARGDTIEIMSVGTGIFIGMWLNWQLGFLHRGVTNNYEHQLTIHQPDYYTVVTALIRTFIGVLILAATRAVLKPLTKNCMYRVLGIKNRGKDVDRLLWVELPYKYITYTCVAFNTSFTVPLLFYYFGIDRTTYYHEF